MRQYKFLADESGHVTQEPGISDEIGPSRYLSMGGCLIESSRLQDLRKMLDQIRSKFKKSKNLHATDISHVQKLYLIREFMRLGVPCFGVVSDKSTLRGFKEKSGGNSQDYYNRTALYLLSNLGRYLQNNKIDGEAVEIIFEQRSHDYQRFRNYVSKVQRNPSGDEVLGVTQIVANKITTVTKDEEHALAIPDMLAHAIFSAFDRNRNNFGITEPRYLDELMDSFCDSGQASRFHLIQIERIRDVCTPTAQLMKKHGFEFAEG